MEELNVVGIAALLESASAIAGSSAAPDTSLQWAVDHVCALTHWPVGHIYLLDDADELQPTGVWHLADEDRFAPFVAATDGIRLVAHEGLPGRIVAQAEPAWAVEPVKPDTPDKPDKPDTPGRAAAAAACGLVSSYAFPIVGRVGIEGVMEFFSDAGLGPAPEYLDIVSHVGRLVGHLHDQERARAAVVHSEARMVEAQRLANLGSWSWEVGTDRLEWSDQLYRIYGLDPGAVPLGLDTYLAQVHTQDRSG